MRIGLKSTLKLLVKIMFKQNNYKTLNQQWIYCDTKNKYSFTELDQIKEKPNKNREREGKVWKEKSVIVPKIAS